MLAASVLTVLIDFGLNFGENSGKHRLGIYEAAQLFGACRLPVLAVEAGGEWTDNSKNKFLDPRHFLFQSHSASNKNDDIQRPYMNIKMTPQAYCPHNCLSAILIAALLSLMSGCSSLLQEASPEMKQQALSFKPPAGMAGLYVIRKHHLGHCDPWDFRLDYQDFGSMMPSYYLYNTILPGKHFLRPGPLGEYGIATFVAEAGKCYYFLIKPSFSKHPFTQLSEAEGQQYVRQYKMSADEPYKAPFSP
jgi:hypothetical protein